MGTSKSQSFSFTNAEMPVRFGRYMLLRRLAMDVIGEYFLALWGIDEGIDQLRIVRAIYPGVAEDENFVALFSEEARSLSQLLSANAVRVVEVGVESDIPFVAQEHVEGLTLDRLLVLSREKGDLCTWELAVHITAEMLRGLDYVHRREDVRGVPLGIRHGDVRPQNVLISYSGEVKLTNFSSSLYYMINEATNARFKTDRGIYAPPEGYGNNNGPTVADDLWGASVILLALVAGPKALEGLKEQSESDILPSVAYAVEGIPKRLNLFLARALHPEPESRFESAFQMRDMLLEIIRKSATGHAPDDLAAWAWHLGTEDREDEERFVRSMLGQDPCMTLDESADTGRMCPGVVIEGKYHLLRMLGEGGMGMVFEAEHLGIEKRVAVKVLHERVLNDKVAVERFKREAKIMGGLRHPSIVEVYDYGETEEGNYYLIMELLDGITMASRIINQGPVPPEELVSIMIAVCSGLEAAHEAGVIHRDLKPENIFLTSSGPRIVDFGIAKRDDLEDPGNHLTQTGNICGTVEYLSPEQLKGQGVDTRHDVYTAGLIMYESLTGHTPFRGRNIAETMHRVMTDKVVPPRKRTGNLNIPLSVERVCLQAMSRNLDKRYQSAREMREALEALLPLENVISTPPAVSDKSALYRNIAIGLVTTMVTVLVGMVVLFYAVPERTPEEATPLAAVPPTADGSETVSSIGAHPRKRASGHKVDAKKTAPKPAMPAMPAPAAADKPTGSAEVSTSEESTEAARVLTRMLISNGETAFESGDFDRALGLFQRAVELDKSASSAWYGLGRAIYEKGDTDKAVSAVKRALRLSPSKYKRRLYLGKLYMSAGRRERAIQEWRQVYDMIPAGKREAAKLLESAGVNVGRK